MHTEALREQLRHWLANHADETLLRWLFRAVLAATVAVVALDYHDLTRQMAERANAPGLESPDAMPLPSIKRERGARHGVPSRKMEARLNGKMTFDLVDGGRLMAIGTIVPGTAKAFAAEVQKRGDYVKTVVLQSPGGSVDDALAMGRLIRARKFATEVGRAPTAPRPVRWCLPAASRGWRAPRRASACTRSTRRRSRGSTRRPTASTARSASPPWRRPICATWASISASG